MSLPNGFAQLITGDDGLPEGFENDPGELVLAGFRAGLHCALGKKYAALVLADLFDRLGQSNEKVAKELGVTRAAVSKLLNRCRRNLGWPLRSPRKEKRVKSKETLAKWRATRERTRLAREAAARVDSIEIAPAGATAA